MALLYAHLHPHATPLPPPLLRPPSSLPQTPLLLIVSSPTRTPPPLHGPSLRRGRAPPDYPDQFARAFDLAALCVPAAACAPLERRLRGHLLNWPRVRDVARLPNDQGLALALSLPPPARRRPTEEDGDHAPLTAVARREKLAREFNARGFARFPNLARLSRPPQRKRKENKGGDSDDETTRALDKDKAYVVEVVGEGGEDDADEWKGLVGEEGFGKGVWRMGPTRLLLLDERYADRTVDELPEAVKVVTLPLQIQGSHKKFSLYRVLQAILPEGIIIPTGFETVGHIAHLNLRDEHLPHKKSIAQVVLDKNKPKIQTVVNKTDAIQNDYRTMQLEVLAGKESLHTTVTESGLRFQVDLGTVYWNSRLATERQRLVDNIFRNSDVVCDMFSGVGPLAISAAKKVQYVYANDINPAAVEYLEKNVVLNKIERKIEIVEDVHELQIDDVGCLIQGNGHIIEEGEDLEVVPLRRKKTKKRKVIAAPLSLSPSRRPMACLWLCGAR
ncbi:hypothetical protein PR202_gb20272 [Eleusine coracana subsp. coracana]|uniref:SAM-dependent methyltransferase TRM5/TYW2-type domain-containing protein n=1 Tax=Eleusine coracana subsp. coracana TaxID=191504 RepID=A0AAV5FBV2_ELECO|nr:hypothetical protein PR202_gb20272 [Eleusine coracana subsp. coracana]